MTREEMIITARQYMLEVKETLDRIAYEDIAAVVEALANTKLRNGRVLIVGNGGSAATASHFANDLMKMAELPAIAIPDMVPSVTAHGNDLGWSVMFSAPLSALFNWPEDMIVAISCSGKSANVLDCLYLPDEFEGAILLTGNAAPQAATEQAGFVLSVPNDDIRIQEDVHLMLCHIIAGLVRDAA